MSSGAAAVNGAADDDEDIDLFGSDDEEVKLSFPFFIKNFISF